MDKTLTLEFTYGPKNYYAIVRTKTNKGEKQYYITIMNGDLERLLYGHHVIAEQDGVLQPLTAVSKTEVAELRNCILMALYHHLEANGFSLSLHGYSKLN